MEQAKMTNGNNFKERREYFTMEIDAKSLELELKFFDISPPPSPARNSERLQCKTTRNTFSTIGYKGNIR